MPTSPFLALQHRNFRLIWIGQLISMSGSMMQSAAILWHVSLLAPENQKGLALGLVGLVRVIPIIVFSLISGVVADAVDRRKLMLATQTGMTLAAAALAVITFRGLTVAWPVYLLTALSPRPAPSTIRRGSRSSLTSCPVSTSPTPSACTRSCSRRPPCSALRWRAW